MIERVLLVDIDSTIPNLALMKISTYWKNQGAEVGFNVRETPKTQAMTDLKRWTRPQIFFQTDIEDYNRHRGH